jgi:uncharacterized protein (TIGR00369 family)
MMADIKRTLTVSWDAPQLQEWSEGLITGLDYLKGLKDGRINPPPVGMLVGYNICEVRFGYAAYELIPGEYHYNPFGTVHGGIISTLLDSTMTSAIITTLDKGKRCSTSDVKVNFIKPVTTETGPLRCEAEPIHVGNSLAIAEGRVMDQDGQLYAHGVSTCLIIST